MCNNNCGCGNHNHCGCNNNNRPNQGECSAAAIRLANEVLRNCKARETEEEEMECNRGCGCSHHCGCKKCCGFFPSFCRGCGCGCGR